MEYGKLDFGVKIGSISETEITDIVGIECLHKVAHGLSFDTKTGDLDWPLGHVNCSKANISQMVLQIARMFAPLQEIWVAERVT